MYSSIVSIISIFDRLLIKMTITDELKLPSDEEINHKVIPVTHNYMLSSAMWLGKYCDNQCKEYMLCRAEERDPRKCLAYGREVTDCGIEFFKKVKKTCRYELEWYTRCLDFTESEPRFISCRKEQAVFDGCMYENGFERAPFGYFQLLRVHDSKRPPPKKIVPIFDDAVESYNAHDEANKVGKGTGGRQYYKAWS